MASSVIKKSTNIETTIVYDVNLNDIDYTYLGYVVNATNTPLSGSQTGFLISLARSNNLNYRKQIYSPFWSNDLYVRTLNETWTNWSKITLT